MKRIRNKKYRRQISKRVVALLLFAALIFNSGFQTLADKDKGTESITKYDYKSDEVNVLVTLTDPEDLPDEAELVVTPITLQREAKKNIEDAAAADSIFVEEIKAFDIKFMLNGEEVQPGATVKVNVTVPEFKPDKEASAVYHLDENNEVENMDSEVKMNGAVEFEAPHFSTYVIVDGLIVNDATKKITVTLKHYNKEGYVTTGTPGSQYQLYADKTVVLPVGGEIYNYITADNWKPDTVVVDYPNGSSESDKIYTNSSDLKEISLEDSATVWVYYTPDSSRFYGDSRFYDYTVMAGVSSGKYYSINMEVAANPTNPTMIVGYAGSATKGAENYDQMYRNSYTQYIDGTVNEGDELTTYPVEVGIENGEVEFNHLEPGFFENEDWIVQVGTDERELRKVYNDFQLGFERSGNTYTFDQVVLSSGDMYNKGVEWSNSGDNFFPLDDFTNDYEEAASLVKHNAFFGMRYDISFFVGDYLGDMDFEYTGKGEFWLILDGGTANETLLINKTGYESLTKTIDLKSLSIDTTIEHTLTVLYLDRYATNGSQCKMSFTLPNAKIKEVSANDVENTTELTLKTVDEKNNPLEGATFQLKNTSTNAMETLTTTDAGVTFSSLSAGEYSLLLANAPDNCVVDVNSWKVTIKEVNNQLVVSLIEESTGNTVNPTDGVYIIGVEKVEGTKLVLQTVSDNDDSPLPLGNAEFKLESIKLQDEGSEAFSKKLYSDFSTGKITFTGLRTGTYKLTHMSSPKGCTWENEDTEWTVTVMESNGSYTVTMTTLNGEPVNAEDGVFIFKYKVNKDEYVKPDEALSYDKKAKVLDWDNRKYEINISARSLEVESIKQIDTTYGVFVFDKSTTMVRTTGIDNDSIGEYGDTFSSVKTQLNIDNVYQMGHWDDKTYVIYRDDNSVQKKGWYSYNPTNGWNYMEDNATLSGELNFQDKKLNLLKEVAITYVKNLAENAPNSMIGVSIFNKDNLNESTVKTLSTIYNEETFDEEIFEAILGLYNSNNEQGSYMNRGLQAAFGQFFDYTYDATNDVITSVKEKAIYTTAQEKNIPLYVIVVSDGMVDSEERAKKWAGYLKDKGIKVYTIATNNSNEEGYQEWLKENIASFGCSYVAEDPSKLSDIFMQIQKEVSVPIYTDVTVTDAIDRRFVILDDNETQTPITEVYYNSNKRDVCINKCEDGNCTCDFKAVEVTYDGKTGFVYYENGKQYIKWTNQTISETDGEWSIAVKAQEDYIGGNNVNTNISEESKIVTPSGKTYELPNPQVNVKAELIVNDNEFMIYDGETVPTDEEILKLLFDSSSEEKYSKASLVKYGVMENLSSTYPITLTWYSDEECENKVTSLENIKPTENTKYYLQVTYDTCVPSDISKENTTLNGREYYVGEQVDGTTVYREKANKLSANGTVERDYGIYTINVWKLIKREKGSSNTLPDAKFELTSAENKYYGKSSEANGVVVWYSDESYVEANEVTNIAAGTYTLTETIAPEGYALNSGTVELTKNAESGWVVPTAASGLISAIQTENNITKAYVDNEAVATVTIDKVVTGNMGDNKKLFSFEAELKDENDQSLNFPGTNSNKIIFELSDVNNEDNNIVKTITDLPVGAKLTITEKNYGEYTVSTQVGSENAVNGPSVTITIPANGADITFINDYTRTISTGIDHDTPTPLMIMLAVVVMLAFAGIFVKVHLDNERKKHRIRR